MCVCIKKRHSLEDRVSIGEAKGVKDWTISGFGRDQGPEERLVFEVVDGKTNNAPVRERLRERETLASTGWSDKINTRHIDGRSHPVLSNGRDEEGPEGQTRSTGHGDGAEVCQGCRTRRSLLCRWNTRRPSRRETQGAIEQCHPRSLGFSSELGRRALAVDSCKGRRGEGEGGEGDEGAAKHPSCGHGNTGRGGPFLA